jgi:RimJ/RimL family protein N-acetyltransferase
VTFSLLEENEIELVRNWRNSDKIRQYANHQEYISVDQQQRWFSSLSTSDHAYFMITINDQKIGLVWARNIHSDWCETGFYIYEDRYLNSIYSYKVVSILHNYLFNDQGLEAIYCEILPDNKRAIRFNLSLGYKFLEGQHYQLKKADYVTHLKKIERVINR